MSDDPLLSEVHHRRRVSDRMSMVRVYIGGCIGMSFLTIVAVVTLAIARPDSGSTMSTVIGFTLPVTMALLAAGVQGIHRGMEGRFSQLLVATAEKMELETRAATMRDLQMRIERLDPNSQAYAVLLEQIKTEALKPFTAHERRINGA